MIHAVRNSLMTNALLADVAKCANGAVAVPTSMAGDTIEFCDLAGLGQGFDEYELPAVEQKIPDVSYGNLSLMRPYSPLSISYL